LTGRLCCPKAVQVRRQGHWDVRPAGRGVTADWTVGQRGGRCGEVEPIAAGEVGDHPTRIVGDPGAGHAGGLADPKPYVVRTPGQPLCGHASVQQRQLSTHRVTVLLWMYRVFGRPATGRFTKDCSSRVAVGSPSCKPDSAGGSSIPDACRAGHEPSRRASARPFAPGTRPGIDDPLIPPHPALVDKVATSTDAIDLVVEATRNRVEAVTDTRVRRSRTPSGWRCSTRSRLTTATAAPTRRMRVNSACT